MKYSFGFLSVCAGALAVFLPLSQSRSQLAPAVEPLSELQSLQSANDDLLKRQDATLKDLTEMTTAAREIKIYSRRG